jgi:deoxyribonuclease V
VRFNAAKARRAQALLARRVSLRSDPSLGRIRLVAGLDVAYAGGRAFGAAALVDLDEMRTLERAVSSLEERVPYIPGFLAFREAGPMISALRRLRARPDAIMVNGHGVAHPRRFGIASHLGVVLNVRSIGVARSRLVGSEAGRSVILDGEEVARILINGRMRIYVSVGHGISLDEAVGIVEAALTRRDSLPLPLQEAHESATAAARSLARGV